MTDGRWSLAGWNVILILLQILQVLILVRVVMSWVVSPASRNPLVEFVRTVTDPILRPIQSVLPNTGPVDLSPMVALFLIFFLQSFVSRMVY
ncbi:MAG TPA: YggT family protein [Longimicrobium sp.]|nr:YggT family protein [Longimicrobium sp.]